MDEKGRILKEGEEEGNAMRVEIIRRSLYA